MKYLALLVLAALLAPTSETFTISSAGCNEVYAVWRERSIDINGDVYVELVTWDTTLVYSGEYIHLSPPEEYWWVPLSEEQMRGRVWVVFAWADTNIGLVRTPEVILDCAAQQHPYRVWVPMVVR